MVNVFGEWRGRFETKRVSDGQAVTSVLFLPRLERGRFAIRHRLLGPFVGLSLSFVFCLLSLVSWGDSQPSVSDAEGALVRLRRPSDLEDRLRRVS